MAAHCRWRRPKAASKMVDFASFPSSSVAASAYNFSASEEQILTPLSRVQVRECRSFSASPWNLGGGWKKQNQHCLDLEDLKVLFCFVFVLFCFGLFCFVLLIWITGSKECQVYYELYANCIDLRRHHTLVFYT